MANYSQEFLNKAKAYKAEGDMVNHHKQMEKYHDYKSRLHPYNSAEIRKQLAKSDEHRAAWKKMVNEEVDLKEYVDPNYETSSGRTGPGSPRTAGRTNVVFVKPKGGGEFGHVEDHGSSRYTAVFHPTGEKKEFNDGYAAHKWLVQTDKDDWAKRKKQMPSFVKKFGPKHVNEDAPCNAVGGGNIAGVGVGPQGEPPVKKSKVIKRFKNFVSKK